MPTPASPLYHIDRPPHWRPAAASLEVAGWLYPGETEVCADIRARVDGRVYLGIYGLERSDIAQSFGASPAALHTGFAQRVQVWRGAKELALDWHDGTQWREFFRTPLATPSLPADAVKPPLVLRAAVVQQTLHYLYRHFHRASCSELSRQPHTASRAALTPNNAAARVA